jgi:hypothetical protein
VDWSEIAFVRASLLLRAAMCSTARIMTREFPDRMSGGNGSDIKIEGTDGKPAQQHRPAAAGLASNQTSRSRNMAIEAK